ncbi:MAG: hypothetical protein C0454_08865 [Parvibaculum sp.]|nr:hypothetical protein [Parvibaculum sp.]
MTHSYVALIDESGDDGLGNFREPGQQGGASSWLIISAYLVRNSRELETVGWRDEILDLMPRRKERSIHFSKLSHGQKLMAAQRLAQKPIRAINIVANKRVIPEGIYREKNQLYFYMTRYLIERISWLCRDMRPQVPEGDGRVRIVFSRRGGMSYPDFRAYLLRLQATEDRQINIHWPVIDVDAISARDHSTSASLQLADTVASAFASAFEPDTYGNCEWRYAEALKRVVYERHGNYLSYGLKLVPRIEDIPLTDDQRRCIDLFR